MMAIAAPPARRPFVLELVGPAGAGKSTLSSALAERWRTANATIWDLPVRSLIVEALRSLPTLVAFVWSTRSLPWREFKHAVRLTALHRRLRRLQGSRIPIVVLDEGPVFTLSWLRLFGHPRLQTGVPGWWGRVFRDWAAVLDLVVLMDAPDPVLAQRIRGRPKLLSVKHGSDGEIFAFSARYRVVFDEVIATLRTYGDPSALTLGSGELAPEQLADALMNTLEHYRHAS
jgi:predicted ATPase